jgi:hypothetical protein
MTTTDQTPAAPAEGQDRDEAEPKSGLGRALDVAGIIAAGFLAVIIFDVVSGGKVTRFVQRRIAARRGEPCDGCDDTPVQAGPGMASDAPQG